MALNKVFLIGNVGKEPEVHYFDANSRKASFTLATTDRGYKRQDGTEVKERTEWHNVVVWRGLAEVVEKYVHKGSKLFVEGKITSRSYEDKTGTRRYVTEITAENIELLNRTEASQEDSVGNNNNHSNPSPMGNDYSADMPDNDSDLPF